MVNGFTKFKERFQGFENQYVIIGGTACDLIMENEELKNKLIEKLEREVNEFKDTLRGLSADEIMDNSYKLTCIIEMKDYLIYNKELSKFELKTLLKREDILEECYDDWLSCDGNLREALEFSIDDTIDLIRDNEVKKERNKDAR